MRDPDWVVGRTRFVKLPPEAWTALLNRDLALASSATGVALGEYFTTESAMRIWRRRVAQMQRDPESARWIQRAVLVDPEKTAVGYSGFHGPPDTSGMLEIAYSVDPAHRRRGIAKAMITVLLARARREPCANVVRASIRPDNAASLAAIASFGFRQVGEQWDDEDGLELVFEVRVRP